MKKDGLTPSFMISLGLGTYLFCCLGMGVSDEVVRNENNKAMDRIRDYQDIIIKLHDAPPNTTLAFNGQSLRLVQNEQDTCNMFKLLDNDDGTLVYVAGIDPDCPDMRGTFSHPLRGL